MSPRTRVDDAIAVTVLAVLVLGAVGWAAFHLLGPRGDLEEVTVFPLGLRCADDGDGDDAETVDVPLVERAEDVFDEGDHAGDPTPPGYVVTVRQDTDLACMLEVGVRNDSDRDVRVDGIDVGGWAPGPVSGNVWELDQDLVGDVEVQETTVLFRFDQELPAGTTTSVPLWFHQREAARIRDDGLESRSFGADVSAWGASRTATSGFTLVTVMEDGTP